MAKALILEKAIKICDDCGGECDCHTCPIGREQVFAINDSGIKVVASVCAILMTLREVLEHPDNCVSCGEGTVIKA